MSFQDLFCFIKPDLKILFHDQEKISVTTTIVVPIGSPSYSSKVLSREFQESLQNLLENFFNQLNFTRSASDKDIHSEKDDLMSRTNGLREFETKPDSTVINDFKDFHQDDLKEEPNDDEEVEDDNDLDYDPGGMDELDLEALFKVEQKLEVERKPAKVNITKRKKKENVKEEKPEMVQCEKCGKEFKRIYIAKHRNRCIKGIKRDRKKYPQKYNPQVCQICGKSTNNEFTMKSHMRSVHAEKVHKCDQCDFRTGNKPILTHHIKTVHGEKEFMCDHCDYSTTLKNSLILHLKTHVTREPVTCTICGKSVISIGNHMRSTHSEEMGHCDICGKEMKKVRISGHKRKVHAEKKHACDQCGYRTTCSSNLKLHIHKSHLGIKDMIKEQCPHCDTKTTNLQRHVRIFHPEK